MALLSPPAGSEWDRLVAAGAVTDGGDLLDVVPAPAADGPTLTDLLADDRDDPR